MENEIYKAYANLANAIIVSAVNDYVEWKVQEHFYPKTSEKQLVR